MKRTDEASHKPYAYALTDVILIFFIFHLFSEKKHKVMEGLSADSNYQYVTKG